MTYADHIRERMQGSQNAVGRPITLRQLARHLGRSYEHCRKILKGEPAASQDMNRDLCALLRLDEQEMWRLAQREKMTRKYPAAMDEVPPDPTLGALWPLLTRGQRAALVDLMRSIIAERPTN